VEFDLEAMFAGEVYADFAVFWLVTAAVWKPGPRKATH
jgi:hypothetical protein